MRELIGQTLGQYEIIEKIGQGGMSTVFKARQRGLERWVAVKVLPPQYATDPDFSRYFLHEARSIAQLEHPHILPVYDFGQQGEYTYLVMRYIANSRSLADVMKGSIPFDQALDYLEQVASALDYAHERNIVHRDIKPANILLNDRWVFLADFGLARVMRANAQLITTGITIGTPAYMSPEQGSGNRVDTRTDIYAAGVITYAMLTGYIPHMAETSQAIIYKRIHEPAPALRTIRPNIPVSIDYVVQKALAPTPAERFQRAGIFLTALTQAIETSGAKNLRTVPVTEISSIPPANPPGAIAAASETTCPHCGKMTSGEASSCTHCGLPLLAPIASHSPQPSPRRGWWLAALVGVLGLMALFITVGIWLASRQLDDAGIGVGISSGSSPSARPRRDFTKAVFFDDFDGVGLNRSAWRFDIGAGQIQVFDSNLRLTGSGQSFPVVLTMNNPFPDEENFRLYVSLRYLNIAPQASGIVLGQLPEAYQANQDKTVLPAGQIIGVWQDANSWRVSMTPENIEVYSLPAPDLDTNEIEIDYVNNLYTVRLNGETIYVSETTTVRPTVLWVGNPVWAEAGASWSGLEIDYIAIEKLSDSVAAAPTPTSATQTTTPSPPPTPSITLLLPGHNCDRAADNSFGIVWETYREQLGCPVSDLKTVPTIAEEAFQGGHLFWRNDTEQVYIVRDRQVDGTELFEGQWRLADPDWKWDGSNPDGVGLSPPPGLVEPKRGFGWLWRTYLGGPDSPLGWALDKEYGFDNLATAQNFEQGIIFKGSGSKIYVLLDNGRFYAQ